MSTIPGYPRAVHEAEATLAASLALDTAAASREDLLRTIAALQTAAGLALDAHAALHAAAYPDASRDAPAPRDASADASDADLLDRARAIDHAHRAAHGRGAPLRKLQAQLRIGQPRAQQLQRALATRTEGSTP